MKKTNKELVKSLLAPRIPNKIVLDCRKSRQGKKYLPLIYLTVYSNKNKNVEMWFLMRSELMKYTGFSSMQVGDKITLTPSDEQWSKTLQIMKSTLLHKTGIIWKTK